MSESSNISSGSIPASDKSNAVRVFLLESARIKLIENSIGRTLFLISSLVRSFKCLVILAKVMAKEDPGCT